MKDYWLLVREPAKVIAALKKHNMHATIKLLVASSLLFGLGISVMVSKLLLLSGAFTAEVFIGLALTVFALLVIIALAMAVVLEFIAINLGGTGRFYEALSAITALLAAPSLGIFIASLLLLVPFIGFFLGPFIIALTLGIGLSSFYRAVKEFFRVDMVTAFIAVSVFILSFFVLVYGALTLTVLSLSLPGIAF